MDELDFVKNQITNYFSAKDDIDTVILFGSFAKKCFNSKSDIDIAIHSKSEITIQQLIEYQTDLSLLCKREIDLADLQKAEGLFLYQIATKGIRLKCDNNVFHHYLMKALYFYEDFLPIIRSVQKEKIKRFING